MLSRDSEADILLLLDEEHDLYRSLLSVAHKQARLIATAPSAETLEQLIGLREDLYARIEAAELARDSLVEDLDEVPANVRSKARAIEATLRAILEQDRLNEISLKGTWSHSFNQVPATASH